MILGQKSKSVVSTIRSPSAKEANSERSLPEARSEVSGATVMSRAWEFIGTGMRSVPHTFYISVSFMEKITLL